MLIPISISNTILSDRVRTICRIFDFVRQHLRLRQNKGSYPSARWAQNFTSQSKDLCLDKWVKDFTSKVKVKISAFEVKIRAYEVKSCAIEVKIRAYEVKISAYEIKS